MTKRIASVVVLLLWLAGPAWAWSTKEHILLTRLAAARLLDDEQTPPEMKAWLRQVVPGPLDEASLRAWYLHARQGVFPRGVDGAAFWAVVPDLRAMTMRPQETVSPFGVHERLLHYIDLEFFDPNQQGQDKPQYKPDGSARPALEQVSRDPADPRYQQAGMLPFRIEQAYGELVKSIRAGRLMDKPGQFPRDDHAARWAGCLAHYVADNLQPHHATVDYKSRSFFPDPASAPDVHAQMEYKPVDDDWADYPDTRRRVWDLLMAKLKTIEDPATMSDVWIGSVQSSMHAYSALPLIGHAARAAWKPDQQSGRTGEQGVLDTDAFYAFEGDWAGRRVSVAEMKAELQAVAVIRIAAHWRKAWDEATAQE